uniref:Uncharacterized protein n=1 Tax=Anguilla anguilla TaxID=7936 RepID=A0A0E9RSC5_ANGAN
MKCDLRYFSLLDLVTGITVCINNDKKYLIGTHY